MQPATTQFFSTHLFANQPMYLTNFQSIQILISLIRYPIFRNNQLLSWAPLTYPHHPPLLIFLSPLTTPKKNHNLAY